MKTPTNTKRKNHFAKSLTLFCTLGLLINCSKDTDPTTTDKANNKPATDKANNEPASKTTTDKVPRALPGKTLTKEEKDKTVALAKKHADDFVKAPDLTDPWVNVIKAVYQEGSAKAVKHGEHQQFCKSAQLAIDCLTKLVNLDLDKENSFKQAIQETAEFAEQYAIALVWADTSRHTLGHATARGHITFTKEELAKDIWKKPLSSISLAELAPTMIYLDLSLKAVMNLLSHTENFKGVDFNNAPADVLIAHEASLIWAKVVKNDSGFSLLLNHTEVKDQKEFVTALIRIAVLLTEALTVFYQECIESQTSSFNLTCPRCSS